MVLQLAYLSGYVMLSNFDFAIKKIIKKIARFPASRNRMTQKRVSMNENS